MSGITGFYHPEASSGDAVDQLVLSGWCLSRRGSIIHRPYISPRRNMGLMQIGPETTPGEPPATYPLTNADGAFQLIFDGQIYNHLDLRHELTSLGHVFQTADPAEVVVHGYESWGSDVLNRMNGMWALALFDVRNDVLFCARDRLGIKPFYYSILDGCFCFASEIRGLLCRDTCPRVPNRQRMDEFLTYGPCYFEDEKDTFFDLIFKLPPGSFCVADTTGTRFHKWWRPDPEYQIQVNETTHEELRALLEDAVRLRVGEVSEMAFTVSGGLDSSSVLFLSLPTIDQPPAILSLLYDDILLDERRYIAAAANAAGGKPCWVTPSADGLVRDLPAIVLQNEEPVSSPGYFGHYLLVKEAATHAFRDICFGHGLDEAAGGYPHHFSFYLADLRLSGKMEQFQTALDHWKTKFYGTDALYEEFYHRNVTEDGRINPASVACEIERSRPFLHSDFVRLTREARQPHQPYSTLLKNALFLDLTRNTLPACLRVEDAACRSASLRRHAPFLDHRIIEFLLALPGEYLFQGGRIKSPVREAMKGVVPEIIRTRPGKVGLNVPWHGWATQELETYVRDCLASNELKEMGIFEYSRLPELMSEPDIHQAGFLWRVIALTLWYAEHIGNQTETE